MDGGERRHMIKCAGGAQDKTIINQIMLRFRPIAPKPAVTGPDSDASSLNNKNLLLSRGRSKRKYVRVRRNNRFKENKKVPSSSDQQNGKERGDVSFNKTNSLVTLQLLPEKTDPMKESPEIENWWCNQQLSYHHHQNLKLKQPVIGDEDPTGVLTVHKIKIESRVTVKCVTDTYPCMDAHSRGLGCTDVERVKNLEEDSCPGFISDGSDNLRRVNGAYKRMMMKMLIKGENKKEQSVEITVNLVTKQKLVPYIYCSAFTCWVRLEYRLGEKTKSNSKMVPCDVWRMDCGGFAWRLDVEAALSLSLGH